MAKKQDLHPPRRKWDMPLFVFFKDARLLFKKDELGLEILQIAVPAALALAADPVASLIDTAFVGHLGPVQLAAVGVSIAIFNQASRITIFPLVSITTSFVAEEETMERLAIEAPTSEYSKKNANAESEVKVHKPEDVKIGNLDIEVKESPLENGTVKVHKPEDVKIGNLDIEVKESPLENDLKMPASSPVNSSIGMSTKPKSQKRYIASASTALVLGGVLGVIQSVFLIFAARPLLGFMGVKSGSPMLAPAERYLTLRSLGAPAVLLSLAMQGVFRGFKDTKTPLYATVAGDVTNIILDPILIFSCQLGVSGAAISHVISQYLISLILLLRLMTKVHLLPPSLKQLQFSRFLKNGFLLLARVIAVTFCVTLAASLAARLGSTPMAAFQICLQVWLTSSLLADGLAVAGQAIIACAFAEKDYDKATAAASRVLQMGFVLGLALAVFVGAGLHFGSGIFSSDPNVLRLISISILFVAATQPINSLAFVFDGVNFGASDFAYSAYSMVIVSILSIGSLFMLSKTHGFIGIWVALTIYMGLRMFAGIWRLGTGTGPWCFLRGRLLP